MNILLHIALFLLALGIVWILSGILIEATNRVAHRYDKPGFAVAFFVLGFLTSIGESSVAFNSTLERVPQVSLGNLVGASIVIFLFIIPLLAIFGSRIELNYAIRPRNMALALLVILLPALFAIDGAIVAREGLLSLLLYGTLIFLIYKKKPLEKTAKSALQKVEREITQKRHATIRDLLYIIVGAVIIFMAGHVLVEESIYITDLIGVPASFAGLLILSIGTNVPEIVIAFRSIFKKRMDIAFGDYLGSATANTVIFGFLSIVNGAFAVDVKEFSLSFVLMLIGLSLFFAFSRTKNDISRKEGFALLSVYICFLIFQIALVVG